MGTEVIQTFLFIKDSWSVYNGDGINHLEGFDVIGSQFVKHDSLLVENVAKTTVKNCSLLTCQPQPVGVDTEVDLDIIDCEISKHTCT